MRREGNEGDDMEETKREGERKGSHVIIQDVDGEWGPCKNKIQIIQIKFNGQEGKYM